jgi:hypothetical protein
MNLRAVALSHKVWRHILADHRPGSDHGNITKAHELVDTGETTDDNAISDDHVTSQCGAVRKYAPITDKGIMAHMGVGHKEILVTYLGNHPPAGCARLKGDTLTNDVAIADDELTGLSTVFKVLRSRTDGSELKDRISIADLRVPLDHHMRTDGVIAT